MEVIMVFLISEKFSLMPIFEKKMKSNNKKF